MQQIESLALLALPEIGTDDDAMLAWNIKHLVHVTDVDAHGCRYPPFLGSPLSTSRISNGLHKSSMHLSGTLNKPFIDKQRSTQLDAPNILDKKSIGQRSQVVENVTQG